MFYLFNLQTFYAKYPSLLPFAASAPTRTLGRRKLVRNRFTIDTDIVFDGEPEQDLAPVDKPDDGDGGQQPELLTGDTDRWVEEQFDLDEYEDQDELKETDIVSDEDDAAAVGATLRRRAVEADLEARITALSLASEETEESESLVSPEDVKPSLHEENHGEDEDTAEVWVRRGQSCM